MVIRIRWKNDIIWPLLILFMIRFYTGKHELIFVLSLVWILTLTVRNHKFVLCLPRIKGLLLYVTVIAVSTFIGAMYNETRDVIKDIFYISQTVAIMIVGYQYYYIRKPKDIKKTLYIVGFLMAIIPLIRVVINISEITDLTSIRSIASKDVYEVAFIFAILLVDKLVINRVIFTKTIDWIIAIVMVLDVAVSMGRTELIATISMVFTILLLNILIGENKGKKILNVGGVLIFMILLIGTIYMILPESIQGEFQAKLDKSFNEVNNDLEYDNYAEAIQHWRGFEIEQAKEQWKEAPIWQEMIGQGFGTYIKVKYIPNEFTEDMSKGNSIALLHNAYYTLLVKCGILGTIALIWLYLSNILQFFTIKEKWLKKEAITIVAITVGMILMSYVVNGNFGGRMWITWGIMVGWINAEIRAGSRKRIQ